MSLKAPLAGSRVIAQASATNGFWIALIVSSSDKEAKHRGTKIAGEVDDSYLYGDEEKNAASSDCPNVAGDGLRVRLNASDEDLCSAA